MVEEFIEDLRQAIPNWGIDRSRVMRITAGVLPAAGPGKADMARRSTFVKHGINGLFSLCGIKYTTAPSFARQALDRVFGPAKSPNQDRWEMGARALLVDPSAMMALDDDSLSQLAYEEAVTCVEDFMERRMDWILNEAECAKFEARLSVILGTLGAIQPGNLRVRAFSGN
jgi:glycerol-3-phosphate dehydrogenase